MTTRQLVFVHGRAQERVDSISLKAQWIDAWKEGLAKSGLSMPIAENDVRFPYYGDTLEQMVRGLPGEQAARVIVRGEGIDDAEQAFARDYLLEVQDAYGIDDDEIGAAVSAGVRERGVLSWGWVQGVLGALDAKVPGASAASIALATTDVYRYLTRPSIRATMDAAVRSAFTAGRETVIVAHSLGTVVAYNVLRARPATGQELVVPLFVTLGSPLAINVVKKQLRPIGHPACVKAWLNVMDPGDLVALFALDSTHFDVDPPIENKTDVNNSTENRHGIGGYLTDPAVAKRIHDALVT